MISAVSGVNFRGENDFNALINQPGKFASGAPAASGPVQSAGDRIDLSDSVVDEEKSNTGKVIGGIIGALALAWIGLGIAVGRKGSKWEKIPNPEGIVQKAQNLLYTIGKSASDAYDKTLGKWFSKKADDVTPSKGDNN